MKKFVSILICIVLAFTMVSCGSDKVIDGKTYETYGLFNESDEKDPNIKYKPIWGNIIWGCFLVETIIAPVYFFGFSMYEPITQK